MEELWHSSNIAKNVNRVRVYNLESVKELGND
jgi:hypothetical protein